VETSDQKLGVTQLDVLMQPLHPDRIKNRTQGGRTLSYVEGYDIKATLIRIFGFGGFSAEVIDSGLITIREADSNPSHVYTTGDNKGQGKTPQVICHATVRLTIFGFGPDGQDVVYTESAIGSNSGWDIGDAADNAIKSAATDALKRCATYLGSQFGLSLYDNGRSYEVVQVIFEPKQGAMLGDVYASRQATMDERAAQARAALDRATAASAAAQGGAQPPEGTETPPEGSQARTEATA
jgi:recombination DNA repair RAD52 pathway protein